MTIKDEFPPPPLEAYMDDVVVPFDKSKGVKAQQLSESPKAFHVSALDELNDSTAAETVQGLYGSGHLLALVGAPNAGKTALGVDHGLFVAANETWFNLKVAGGPVIYFAPEAPASVIMRAKAAKRRKFSDRRLPFYVATGTPELGGEATSIVDTERMVATIQAVESEEGAAVKLVQIDTLASCLGGGEENGDGMIRLVSAAKHVATVAGCAVMLIHHPSKGDSAGLRGHGSLAAACDTILTIAVDDVSGTRTATLIKSRDSATGLQFCYSLEPVTLPEPDSFGDPRTTIIVKPMAPSAAPRKRPGGKAQEQLLTELERRFRTGETSWDRAAIIKAGRDLGMHRNSPPVAAKGLLTAGFLVGSDARLSLKYPPECT
jgi:hypothetical protein